MKRGAIISGGTYIGLASLLVALLASKLGNQWLCLHLLLVISWPSVKIAGDSHIAVLLLGGAVQWVVLGGLLGAAWRRL